MSSDKELGRLEGIVQGLAASINEVKDDIKEMRKFMEENHGKYATRADVKENSNRIAKLEQWRWWLMGGFAVVAVIANIASDKIVEYIHFR